MITQNNYILTNHHITKKTDQITIIFNNNKEFETELVDTDSLTNVTIIKIDTQKLPSTKINNSDDLEINK